MSEAGMAGAFGYEREMPGGWTFEIGNEWLTRRIYCVGGRIGTTSLAHSVSGEEYLVETMEEFALVLARDGERRELSFRDFSYIGHSITGEDGKEWTLKIDLETRLEDTRWPGISIPGPGAALRVSVVYQAQAVRNFMRKWLDIPPTNLPGWVVEQVTLEHLRFKETVEGVAPVSRYPEKYPGGEDNVHVEPDAASTVEPGKRFDYGDRSRALLAIWSLDEGLFFFTANLLGSETFDRPSGLLMSQKEYTPLTEGFAAGPAVMGAYSGPPEIGFKRYREFLEENWCAVGKKPVPVSWNTWFITLKHDVPLRTNYDRNLLLDYLDLICRKGFYDVLHLDLGWEAGWPLSPDREKFPNGLDEVARRARECGLDMGYWVNPFSSNYWKSNVEEEHPEWLNPAKTSGKSSAHAVCQMTEYFSYVKARFLELVTRYNARVIYWDGGDWNIPVCTAQNHEHRSQHELEVRALKRLAELVNQVHEARPDALVIGFNLPYDNHRLSSLDQEQVSDTYKFPTVKSELIQRQQMYQMTFEHPYRAISPSWYGVNWIDAGEENLTKRPSRELIHAEMSMIAYGVPQAGASIDLKQAKPVFMEFLSKMFAWRKRFEEYFLVYQHILGFPDGENVDGSGHIIDGKGFLVLVNPTEAERTIALPLDEPELELSFGQKYEITDWSDFERGRPLGAVGIADKLEIELAPLEVKIIGVGV
ncbi:MAG: alpha-galactosidase [Armatimonadetes bacterium]|nr:alpha-galactosidase [Armatimonadota bacterium]